MALIQISQNVMINPARVDVAEFIEDGESSRLTILTSGRSFVVTQDPVKVLDQINKSLAKEGQFFGG
jgi:translation initiation factor IF-3